MTTRNSASLVIVAGAACGLLYLSLAMLSRSYGDVDLLHGALVYGLAALLLFGLVALLPPNSGVQPPAKHLFNLIVVGAVLFRLLGVFTFPVFEDDFYRYLWDGRITVETGQPFGQPPADWFGVDTLDAKFSAILDGINYPDVATVYGPTLQWLFAASYIIAPGELWPLQLAAALADLGVVLVLVTLCAKREPVLLSGCLLYAWSPLLIKEFATTAHPDVFGVLLVVLALLGYCRERWFWLGACLGLAVGVKPFALVIAPFLIGLRWRSMVGFGASVVLVSLPFLLSTPAVEWPVRVAAIWLPEGLRVMSNDWLFNAPLYLLADAVWISAGAGVGDLSVLKAVLVGCFTVLWLWQLSIWLIAEHGRDRGQVAGSLKRKRCFDRRLKRLDQLPHSWLFGVFFLVTPVLNPWYLVWWLPFVALCLPQRQWVTPWVASVAVGLSYGSGINLDSTSGLGLYEMSGWLVGAEFGLIGVALGWDYFNFRRKRLFR